MSEIKTVAFIGLGVMGAPMARHLIEAGFDVRVYNRTRSVAHDWQNKHGGDVADTPFRAAEERDLVLLCVGDDADVREVLLGDDGALPAMSENSIIMDHTTTSASLAEEMNDHCAQAGVGWLDAPVSGGQAGAENGSLTAMLGGQKNHYETVQSVLDCYARRHRLIGPAGHGQRAKMANQIAIAGVLQGLAEALHFADSADLNTEALLDCISQGAAQSWQMDNRAKTMLAGEFDFGFACEWMRKDLGHALAEARRKDLALPLTALVDQFYGDIQAMGGRRWDTSSLIERLRRLHKSKD